MTTQTSTPKAYTFIEVLENEEGRKMIEAIEHLDDNREDHKEIKAYWVAELKAKFNYDYK